MKTSSSTCRRSSLYCCWILTFTLFLISINKSVCQPHNFFKGNSVSMTQLPSKSLPRIGRRSGAAAGMDGGGAGGDMNSIDQNEITGAGGGRLDPDTVTITVDDRMNDQRQQQPQPLLSNFDFYNTGPAGAAGMVDLDPEATEYEIYRNSKLLAPSSLASGLVSQPATDRGLIYIWKTLARRESEAARRRGKLSTGGFKDQPTGIHPFR